MANIQNSLDDPVVKIDTRSKKLNVFLVGACLVVLLAIRMQVNQPTTGDEPHYLLMSYSLIHNHTLNLKSAYVNKDYLGFYPYPLPPQGNPSLISLKNSKVYSIHGIGLPILLVPGFWFSKKSGAVFEMVLLATLVVWLTWVWTYKVTKNRKVSYLVAGLLVSCYFFNGLVGYIYPDMAISAASLVILIMLVDNRYRSLLQQTLIGIVLGYMTLLHIRTLDIVLPVLLILTYKMWKSDHKLPWVTTLIVCLFVAYSFISLHQWFGTYSINTVYGGGDAFNARLFSNIGGILFDSSRGLLIYNPIVLLVFVGIPLWFKKNRETLIMTLVALGPSMCVLAAFTQWNGGAAPSGRYVIDFLPALMPAVALVLLCLRKLWQRIVIGVLAALTILISLDAILNKFPLVNSVGVVTRSPMFIQIQVHTKLAIDRYLPSYSNATILLSTHGILKPLLCYFLVLILFVYGIFVARSLGKTKKLPATVKKRLA